MDLMLRRADAWGALVANVTKDAGAPDLERSLVRMKCRAGKRAEQREYNSGMDRPYRALVN